MRNKKILISLIVALVIILGLTKQYLELRQNYNRLKSQVKYEITSHLISSVAFAKRIDLNKITTGDKNSILNMMYMYENISNLDAILTTTYYYGKIDVIDSLMLRDYKMMLIQIIDKSMQNQLSPEDTNNISLITEDIKQIYKYVNESNELSSEKSIKELKPKLKIYQIKQDK